ncbi:MAG TPA: hypothetical protein VLT90_13180 [Terriglobales bacterium]|nr:hypothetical protein [Terriglobales bacterium]
MASNTPSGAYYASVQDMQATLDFNESAYNVAQIKDRLAEATDLVDGYLHRNFFPVLETRSFDWPPEGPMIPWRLWLDQGNEIISVTSMTSGGVSIPGSNIVLQPNWSGPPFNRLEILIGTNSFLTAGSTWQNAIQITGVWGYSNQTISATTLAASISTTSATTLTVSDSSRLGIGNVILVDSEYMVINDRNFTSTSQSLQTTLSASAANNTVAVTTGSAYVVGETILLDAEQMLVLAISGNNLIVKRAFNGSVLAAHIGSTIFASRLLTVTRAALGTTAATHSNGATVNLHWIPPAVKSLCVAEAGWLFQGQASAWQTGATSRAGSAKNSPALNNLIDLRAQAQAIIGRSGRTRHV